MNDFAWVPLYRLKSDKKRIQDVQQATITTEKFGIVPDPHLFASEEWWRAVEAGEKESFEIMGTIKDVFWGSMADWPMFSMIDDAGVETEWTRDGGVRRYVSGLRARVRYVYTVKRFDDEKSKTVLEIDIENSVKRSSGVAPGPGGCGYEIVGGVGTLIHYFIFKDDHQAKNFAKVVDDSGKSTYVYSNLGSYFVTFYDRGKIWADRSSRVSSFSNLLKENDGKYDGSEAAGVDSAITRPAF